MIALRSNVITYYPAATNSDITSAPIELSNNDDCTDPCSDTPFQFMHVFQCGAHFEFMGLIDIFDDNDGLWKERTNGQLFSQDTPLAEQELLCGEGGGYENHPAPAPWTGTWGLNPLENIFNDFNSFNCDCDNPPPNCDDDFEVTELVYEYNPYMCEVYDVEMPLTIDCDGQQLTNPHQRGNDLVAIFTFSSEGVFGSPSNVDWSLTLPSGLNNQVICYGCDNQPANEVVFTIKNVSTEINAEEIKVSATAEFLECGEVNGETTFITQIINSQGDIESDDLLSIDGDREICDNQIKAYNLTDGSDVPPLHCIDWTSSSSIDIVSTSTEGIIEIRPNTSTADEYWIQATENLNCGVFNLCTPPRLVRLHLDVADICSAGCVSNTEEYVNITEDEVWDERTSVAGDVIVWPGAQLTITSEVYFTEGHGLDIEKGAKVHLDGGTLTKCSSADSWRGVRVRGNPNLFQPDPFSMPSGNQCGVFLSQNGTIEGARYGVYAGYNHSNLYPPNHSGGLVYCENTTFVDNATAVLIPKYNFGSYENESRFRDCHFEGGENGVIIQGSDGIQFGGCSFVGQSDDGIRTYNSGCLITDGCRFFNCEDGIRVYYTSPSSSGEPVVISSFGGTENRFERNTSHIQCSSNGLNTNVVIDDNYFGDCTSIDGAVVLYSPTSAQINDNTFSGSMSSSIFLYDIGANTTDIYCNDFDVPNDGSTAIWAEGDNSRTEITTNIFNTDSWDILLTNTSSNQGKILSLQGNDEEGPANNCFTSIHKNHLFTHGSTTSFSYYLPENPEGDCLLEPSPEGEGTHNYAMPFTTTIRAEDCIPGIEGFLMSPCDDYITIKNEYDDLVATYGSNAGTAEGLVELIRVGRIKEAAISECLREAILSGETDFIKQIVEEEGTVDALYKYYGVNVRIKDFEKAEGILNSIPVSGEEEQHFVDVQAINLRRYKYEQENADFELTPSEYSLLDEVAHGNSKSKGYAMGLLSLLEGVEIDIEKSPIEEGYSPEDTGGENTGGWGVNNTNITVSPNPASDGIKVDFPDYTDEKVFFAIYGISSEPVKTFEFDGGNTFELKLDGVPDGLYALRIAFETELLEVVNIVVAH